MHLFISIYIIMMLCLCFGCDIINSVLLNAILSIKCLICRVLSVTVLSSVFQLDCCESLYPEGCSVESDSSVSEMFPWGHLGFL